MADVPGIHYPRGLHQQPIFEEAYGKLSLPNTEYLAENILVLPVHHGLSRTDVERIVEGVQEARISFEIKACPFFDIPSALGNRARSVPAMDGGAAFIQGGVSCDRGYIRCPVYDG